jgi:hypothetical protein
LKSDRLASPPASCSRVNSGATAPISGTCDQSGKAKIGDSVNQSATLKYEAFRCCSFVAEAELALDAVVAGQRGLEAIQSTGQADPWVRVGRMLHLCNWVGQSISAILLPAHRSPLTAHRSPLTAHRLPLTAHLLPYTPCLLISTVSFVHTHIGRTV